MITDYVKITTPIYEISSKEVEFRTRHGEICIRREHQGLTNWKLGVRGLLMLKQVAEAYQLDFAE